MIQNLYYNKQEQWLVNRIKEDDRVYIMSDGSFHPGMKLGIAAWVITSSEDYCYYLLEDNLTLG